MTKEYACKYTQSVCIKAEMGKRRLTNLRLIVVKKGHNVDTKEEGTFVAFRCFFSYNLSQI